MDPTPPAEFAADAAASAALVGGLRARHGAEAVLSDDGARRLAGHDIFFPARRWPAFVFRPGSVAALADGVRRIADAGLALAPRGGGMSYTGGYLPQQQAFVTVDLARLNRVLEINADDRHVTVEAGCTWAQLRQALAGTGLTTPYAGPLSGLRATVGGALSQNSMFFGAGQHGSAAESVLGLQVVLASGEALTTGSAAFEGPGSSPFARWGGPDLTGLFLGDTGAFGIKATATLRLVPAKAAQGFASYGFPDIAAMVGCQVALMRAGLGSECFGIDAYKARNSAQTGNKLAQVGAGVATLAQIARTGPSLLAGLKAAAGVAVQGTGYLDAHPYSIHLALDGDSPAHVDALLGRVAEIAAEHRGTAQPASVPQVLRAQPFQPLRSVLAHDGDRWVPIHGILPLSRAQAAVAAVESHLATRAEAMRVHGVLYSPLTANLDRAFLYEPCFYWRDELFPLHVDVLGEALTAPWRDRPPAPEAAALVRTLWHELAALLDDFGAVHFQVGRAYRHADRLAPATRALLAGLKQQLDPRHLMNPGSLGL